MPLPPAPSKKAARLSKELLDSPPKAKVAARPKPPSKTAASANQPPALAKVAAPPATALAPTDSGSLLSAPFKPAVGTTNGKAETSKAPKRQVRQTAKHRDDGKKRLFVIDTNVLLHDTTSLFRFEEHDVYLPMIVLEELDANKRGMTEVARNARQASRTLDTLVSNSGGELTQGVALNSMGHVDALGKLFFQTEALPQADLVTVLPQGKADNQILGVLQALTRKFSDRQVVLVSKDINIRVKARALGLQAEDYENDKALNDDELLYTGTVALPADFWTKQGKKIESWQQGAHTYYRVTGSWVSQWMLNTFVYYEVAGEAPFYARVVELRGNSAVLKTLKDFSHQKNGVWGVLARNREQNFALNLLMDPDVDFVTLTGTAGTGKTLLSLVAGLTQVLDDRRYTEIIMTRATVSVGDDIGFLPGTEEEKMSPWMGALDDNLEFLSKGDGSGAGEWGRAATNELIRSRIKIKSLNFMRGRTFLNKFVIIDEAQNLTPKQIKTLITRSGPGTKLVCMGNLSQIDTPYLTEGSSGLTYVVDRFKGWPHGGHVQLARGERSRLADFASDVL